MKLPSGHPVAFIVLQHSFKMPNQQAHAGFLTFESRFLSGTTCARVLRQLGLLAPVYRRWPTS